MARTGTLLVGILTLGLAMACQKPHPPAEKPAAEVSPAPDQEPAAAAPAQPAQSPPTQAPAAPVETGQPVAGIVDPRLTAQLRIFVQEKGRLPETFAEFAGARLDSVPRLGKGLSFAIDPTTQEVKIVSK